jgi:hypothetical protein
MQKTDEATGPGVAGAEHVTTGCVLAATPGAMEHEGTCLARCAEQCALIERQKDGDRPGVLPEVVTAGAFVPWEPDWAAVWAVSTLWRCHGKRLRVQLSIHCIKWPGARLLRGGRGID